MIDSYLSILEDSLNKKLELLKKIESKSMEQSMMLKDRTVNPDFIDHNMDEKLKMINEVIHLDDGFESLYEKIKNELNQHKDRYQEEIKRLQDLIRKVTEKSTSIQAIEARNKSQMEIYFSNKKKEVQSKKSAMSIAKDYYQNMNKVRNVTPQFLDKKK